MKIACGVTGPAPDYRINAYFGRSETYIIVDTESGQQCVLANPFEASRDASGMGAAKLLAAQGIDAVVCGSFGSRAARSFCAADIGMYRIKAGTPLFSLPVLEPTFTSGAACTTYARRVAVRRK